MSRFFSVILRFLQIVDVLDRGVPLSRDAGVATVHIGPNPVITGCSEGTG